MNAPKLPLISKLGRPFRIARQVDRFVKSQLRHLAQKTLQLGKLAQRTHLTCGHLAIEFSTGSELVREL